jgi:hypothetical protein
MKGEQCEALSGAVEFKGRARDQVQNLAGDTSRSQSTEIELQKGDGQMTWGSVRSEHLYRAMAISTSDTAHKPQRREVGQKAGMEDSSVVFANGIGREA